MNVETLTRCCICDSDKLTLIDDVADLQRCSNCGYVVVNPRPTPNELAAYYSKPSKYDHWLDAEKERDLLWKRRLDVLKRTRKPGSLLDVGTGIGQLLHHAKPHYTSVYGTEISETAIAVARDKYGLNLFQGQLEDLPLNQKFDNITLFHILEHVHNPRTFLKRCHDLLETGGTISIAVPNDLLSWELKLRTWWKRRQHRLPANTGRFGLPKIVLDGSVDEIHLSQFTPQSLAATLERLGFKVIVNSIDRYYVANGVKLFMRHLHYAFHLSLDALSGLNRYNTIFVVARKV